MTLACAFHSRSLSKSTCFFVLSLFTLSASAQRPQDPPDYVLKSAPLMLETKTAVPSHVLSSGKYSIQIVDRFSDRYILRVDDADGKAKGTFIGLHDADLDSYVRQHHEGAIVWPKAAKGSPIALRGFSFPDGNTLEFAYPKAEAVALAQANGYSVVAIDPESEGRKPDLKLTPADREVVTLWMLTPTKVGKNQETPAMEAKRFVGPDESPKVAPTSHTLVAKNESPSAPVSAAAAPGGAVVRESRPRVRAFAAKLPQTGSDLPLLALISTMMLSAAIILRLSQNKG